MELPAHRDEASAWREIRTGLRAALGESMYAVWVEPLELVGIDSETLLLRGPADAGTWLHHRYGRVLRRCVREVLGPGVEVVIASDHGRSAPDGAPAGSGPREPGRGAITVGSPNPRYTFDQFIIGDNNRLAHAAALVVAEQPGQTYNPLFMHAPPGLGKTHLLHAIGNFVLAYGGGARVRCATVEDFTNDFIRALTSRSLEGFKHAYRDADVLLIDDVQFLASKLKTEEEFFHTFNALYENGRQLVLTCDRLPSRLDGVAERLRERFASGLVADIVPPDFATRVGILRKRAALDGVPLAEAGVLELIAGRVTDNVRELVGALIRIVAYHSLTGEPITLALARKVLDGMHYPSPDSTGPRPGRGASPPATPEFSAERIQHVVATHYGLSVDEMVSKSRAPRVAWPRQVAIHLTRTLTDAALTAIGAAFGGRDHTTVLHACRRVAQRAARDPQAAVEIDELARALRQGRGDRTC